MSKFAGATWSRDHRPPAELSGRETEMTSEPGLSDRYYARMSLLREETSPGGAASA